jgi:hypothetical protein
MPQHRPKPAETPRVDPTQTGEVGSEGGSPGDLLRSPVRPGAEGAESDRHPRGLPGLVVWALVVPIVVILLWFATSLVPR